MEAIAGIRLGEWFIQNEITEFNFVSLVGHAQNESVYGALYSTDKGLVFQRAKWTEANKSKSVPKVCGEVIYSHKFVDETTWNSFIKIDFKEYLFRDILDDQKLNKKQ